MYKLEVYQTWQNNGYGPNDTTSDAMTYFHHLITNLFKQDRILGDFEFGMVSTNPKFQMTYGSGQGMEDRLAFGFELCSDRIARLYPGYQLDDYGRFLPGKDTATINFDELKKVLLTQENDLLLSSDCNQIVEL